MKTLINYLKESNSNKLVWIDDIRDPMRQEWQNWIKQNFGTNNFDITWIKSYSELVKFLDKFGLPDNFSFDHDLGDIDNPDGEKTGYDCVKYIVDYCIDNNLNFPNYRIQSDNGPGKINMQSYIENYKKHYKDT